MRTRTCVKLREPYEVLTASLASCRFSLHFKISLDFRTLALRTSGADACLQNVTTHRADKLRQTKNADIIYNHIIIFRFCSAGQNLSGRRTFGKGFAKKDIKKFTNDSSQYNSGKKRLMLADKKDAINFADSVLFNKYGKDNILDEKPYEIYFIDNYWWIKGTMPKEAVGGTFKLVVNAVNKEILFLNHQK